MADGICEVCALPDPVGETVEGTVRPNGLEIVKKRVPIGVIGIIYEARPNIPPSDAAALCIKSGNAAFCAAAARQLIQKGNCFRYEKAAAEKRFAGKGALCLWRTPRERLRPK